MYCINGKVSQNQLTFQLCIYINYISKSSFKKQKVDVKVNSGSGLAIVNVNVNVNLINSY